MRPARPRLAALGGACWHGGSALHWEGARRRPRALELERMTDSLLCAIALYWTIKSLETPCLSQLSHSPLRSSSMPRKFLLPASGPSDLFRMHPLDVRGAFPTAYACDDNLQAYSGCTALMLLSCDFEEGVHWLPAAAASLCICLGTQVPFHLFKTAFSPLGHPSRLTVYA